MSSTWDTVRLAWGDFPIEKRGALIKAIGGEPYSSNPERFQSDRYSRLPETLQDRVADAYNYAKKEFSEATYHSTRRLKVGYFAVIGAITVGPILWSLLSPSTSETKADKINIATANAVDQKQPSFSIDGARYEILRADPANKDGCSAIIIQKVNQKKDQLEPAPESPMLVAVCRPVLRPGAGS